MGGKWLLCLSEEETSLRGRHSPGIGFCLVPSTGWQHAMFAPTHPFLRDRTGASCCQRGFPSEGDSRNNSSSAEHGLVCILRPWTPPVRSTGLQNLTSEPGAKGFAVRWEPSSGIVSVEGVLSSGECDEVISLENRIQNPEIAPIA